MKKAVFTVVFATLAAVAAASGDAAEAPRYTMTPTPDGVLRLDTQTGAMSHCLVRNAHWVCESVADDRLALQEEIDRLTRENSRLKQRAEPTAQRPAPPPASSTPASSFLDSFAGELKVLRGYIERVFRDVRELASRLLEEPEPRQL